MSLATAYLDYYEKLIRLDRRGAIEVVNQHLARDGDIEAVYSQILMPALVHTGREWELDHISVAHEHYISEVTRDLIRQLGPRMWADEPGNGPVAVACCAPGERHGIGLMMVCDLLRAEGLTVHSLGEDLPLESVVRFVREVDADLLCLSCALPTHLMSVADLITQARDARPGLQVLVGGRAFDGDADVARKLGAEFFAADTRELRRLLPQIRLRTMRSDHAAPADPQS